MSVAVCLLNAFDSVAGEPQESQETSLGILLEYDEALEGIAGELVDVLRLRLGRYNVSISSRLSGELEEGTDEKVDYNEWQWVVDVRGLGEKNVIVEIDSTSAELAVSEVRTIEVQPGSSDSAVDDELIVENLAWTIGLVVEQTLAPYLEQQNSMVALGVGLAVIEPDIVAGTKPDEKFEVISYPMFHSLALGLNLTGIWNVQDIMLGPRLTAKGRFSMNTLVSFNLGWSAKAEFSGAGVEGTLNQIPIELLFGYLFLNQKHLDIVGWAGASLGFSIYKTSNDYSNRTDLTFVPAAVVLIEVVAKIRKPWGLYVNGGAHVPFIRDYLVNNDEDVYTHVWIAPVLAVGLELSF